MCSSVDFYKSVQDDLNYIYSGTSTVGIPTSIYRYIL